MLRVLLKNRRLRPVVTLIALVSLGAGVAAGVTPATASHAPTAQSARRATPPVPRLRPRRALGNRPNIVFVLTDDLSIDLLRYMPRVQALAAHGLTFSDYFVSDSLCCPSRASIFTGNFPHDTGVFNNVGRTGGFHVFNARGEEGDTFALALQSAGYRTALMGKYLNGYLDAQASDVPATYVPPGWSEWDAAGRAYREFDYTLNENGILHDYGHDPSDYLTDVLARKGVGFIHSSAAARTPFFLELSTFAPHRPYTPAPRNASAFADLVAPEPPNFDVLPSNPPAWLAGRWPLGVAQFEQIDRAFRRRAQSVQAVDAMIGSIEQALRDSGTARDTYIVFSSDNGLHTGEYRLMPGKMTAFDTDIHVPLIISGPGVAAGAKTDAMTENIDLAKTFTKLGGTTLADDGHSLVPLLDGETPANWRNAILVEHHGPDVHVSDPDFQEAGGGNPPSYEAMRTGRFLYVEYADGQSEYYDLRRDPFELHNLAPQLTPSQRVLLNAELVAIESCHDGPGCWSAMHVDRTRPAVDVRRSSGGSRASRRHPRGLP